MKILQERVKEVIFDPVSLRVYEQECRHYPSFFTSGTTRRVILNILALTRPNTRLDTLSFKIILSEGTKILSYSPKIL